ncbi:prion-like-(Q/N-rich) domain-bearing protein 25 [Microplitis demolitor]|uniref:prion-like-(Q/N-rich) domain-bearing protein 25 n=1 Tax=Microplitis demolitor TaxID=69319 RepID=UPI00235B6F88|nr:prion-like-(Q/N-rich) domain-bearing protein 25 [Microplitis demolitor]
MNEINADENESKFSCFSHGNQCDPYRPQGCCLEKDICKYTIGYYVCMDEVILEEPCETDDDCRDIHHAVCSSDNKCTCKTNYFPVNKTSCVPLLGEFCEQNEKCVELNSLCIDNKCKCSDGFIQQTIRKCIPDPVRKQTYLGISCDNNSTCRGLVNYSVCSKDRKCVCDNNYNPIEGGICAPLHGVTCSDNTKCAQDNVFCINNKCRCKPDHVYRDSKCVAKDLGESCNNHRECHGVEFAICSRDKRCICSDLYISINRTKCHPILNGFCLANDQCAVINSICIKNQCQCAFDYNADTNHHCVLRSLGKFCKSNSDCEYLKNSRCSHDNKCVCSDNHFAYNQIECTPVADGYCTNNEQCQFHGFHCIDNKCQCRPNFSLLSADNCIETHLLFSCSDSLDCSEPWHTTCSKDKKCVCQYNNIAISTSTCLPILDGYCWKDGQCQAEYSCDPYRPQGCCLEKDMCKYMIEYYVCVDQVTLGESCETDDDCRDIHHAVCSSDNKCTCKTNYFPVNKTSCIPSLGEFCEQNEKCVELNSLCIDNKCKCSDGFIQQIIRKCIPDPVRKQSNYNLFKNWEFVYNHGSIHLLKF